MHNYSGQWSLFLCSPVSTLAYFIHRPDSDPYRSPVPWILKSKQNNGRRTRCETLLMHYENVNCNSNVHCFSQLGGDAVACFALDHSIRGPALPEHVPHVLREKLRSLGRGKVSTTVMTPLKYEVRRVSHPSAHTSGLSDSADGSTGGRIRTRPGLGRCLAGRCSLQSERQRRGGAPARSHEPCSPRSRCARLLRGRQWSASRWTPRSELGTAKSAPLRSTCVPGRPAFVVRPRIAVRPLHQLLVDPREEAHRAIRQAVSDRLWTRPLHGSVAITPGRKPLHPRRGGGLRRGVGCERMLQRR
jgi:hypothetical protein